MKDHIRVLKPNGMALHVLPSSSWRAWSIATDLIKKGYWTRPHGEFSSNVWTEIYDFGERQWIRSFEAAGFEVVSVVNGGLFYTANTIFSDRLSVEVRARFSKLFGSSTKYFVLTPKSTKTIEDR